MSTGPRFSVLTPLYDTPPGLLEECIASVRAQTFADWELILVDDGSPSPHVVPAARAHAAEDPRIRVIVRSENGGIVAASNDGLAAARGEFVALLDHDDLLHPEALEALDDAIGGREPVLVPRRWAERTGAHRVRAAEDDRNSAPGEPSDRRWVTWSPAAATAEAAVADPGAVTGPVTGASVDLAPGSTPVPTATPTSGAAGDASADPRSRPAGTSTTDPSATDLAAGRAEDGDGSEDSLVLVLLDDVDYAYTDQDLIDEAGRHSEPLLKPDWSPDRFRCQMYTNHLGALRRSLVEEVGGFREGFEGSQDFDLVFRVTERARRIVHVPRILYHWRITPASVNASPDAKPYAWTAGARAIADHCERTGFMAEVDDDMITPGVYRLRPALRHEPLVSLVVPTGGGRRAIHAEDVLLAERCLSSIVERSTYRNYEVVLVADTHIAEADLEAMVTAGGGRVRVVPYDRPFNFSDKCNVGVVRSEGEHVLLLNDDTEVIAPDWLEHLVMYSVADGVGAVGGRLHFGDGRFQHVGLGCLPGPAFGHFYRGFNGEDGGYYGICDLPANFLAVTGACLMSPREVYDEVGGMSLRFPNAYNDVDYCLKVIDAGYRVTYSPGARMFHHESSSRGAEVQGWERELLEARWARWADGDPFYNPNFCQDSLDYVVPPYLADGTLMKL